MALHGHTPAQKKKIRASRKAKKKTSHGSKKKMKGY